MTLMQVWGCLIILIAAPLMGAFVTVPGDRRSRLSQVLEVLQGVVVILLSRQFFVSASPWELLALLALNMGRYWRYQETAMVAVLAGLLLHDWQITLLIGVIGAFGLTLFRQVRWGIWEMLARHGGQEGYLMAAIALAGTLAWISSTSPDSQNLWSLFRPEHPFLNLDRPLSPRQVGQDAAVLSRLKQLGYPVLPGWLLLAGDDIDAFCQFVQPGSDRPLMLRLSSEQPSRRLPIPIEQITRAVDLETAIINSFTSEPIGTQAILIQPQPAVQWSGITYSRHPLQHSAQQEPFAEVVQDLVTPILVGDRPGWQYYGLEQPELQGDVPADAVFPDVALVAEAAQLSRRLEKQQGNPQALEWCFDGQQLWILRVRPIYHLHPVWTRRYIKSFFPLPLQPFSASLIEEIAPGAIANIAAALFPETSLPTEEQIVGYFNQTFWEKTLQRLDLQFTQLHHVRQARWYFALTHPRLLYRYLQWDRHWHLELKQDIKRYFSPTLKSIQLASRSLETLSFYELQQNVEQIQTVLERLCTHQLRGQLILRGRRSLLQLGDFREMPTPKFVELNHIAQDIENLLGADHSLVQSRAELFAHLADIPDGKLIFQQIDQWLAQYGDGADYPWELGQKRWREDAGSIRQRIVQWLTEPSEPEAAPRSWQQQQLLAPQRRLQLVQDLLCSYLAALRLTLLAIAKMWCAQGLLAQPEDIFWLKLPEFRVSPQYQPQNWEQLRLNIQSRRAKFPVNQSGQKHSVPSVIYGQVVSQEAIASSYYRQKLQGQTASSGYVIGRAKLCRHWQQPPAMQTGDILVTPYLHENLLPLLSQVKGVVTTGGGMLSHGASLARQGNLPMIMRVTNALDILQTGQWIRLDGQLGLVELLDPDRISGEESSFP
jgi:pyruvate,water dikinase